MKIKAVLCDVNGTLVDISTDEQYSKIYRFISRFLTFHGIDVHHELLKDEYCGHIRHQRRTSPEEHPEYDAQEAWREILRRRAHCGWDMDPDKIELISRTLAEMYRGISRTRLEPYPGVAQTLDRLRSRLRLGVVSDAQSAWARAELRTVGLDGLFEQVVISGDHGFRKPDRRLFETALHRMELAPWEAVYVGNDTYRDVYGPKQLGMKTVLFASNQARWRPEGPEPDFVIHDFRELPQAIEFFERQS